jgi:hypothetical protein
MLAAFNTVFQRLVHGAYHFINLVVSKGPSYIHHPGEFVVYRGFNHGSVSLADEHVNRVLCVMSDDELPRRFREPRCD